MDVVFRPSRGTRLAAFAFTVVAANGLILIALVLLHLVKYVFPDPGAIFMLVVALVAVLSVGIAVSIASTNGKIVFTAEGLTGVDWSGRTQFSALWNELDAIERKSYKYRLQTSPWYVVRAGGQNLFVSSMFDVSAVIGEISTRRPDLAIRE